MCLCGLGKKEEAIKNYELALSKNPNFTEAYYNLGNKF
jgi:hypothetical protein